MFSCVWLHFKKFSGKYFLVFGKEEGKHKSKKHKPQPRKKIINDRDLRSRDHGRWTGAREIGADWSSEYAGDRRTD